jgi:hypothetical protein
MSNSGNEAMTEVLWLLIVAGGPILIGLAIAYGIFNRRTLTAEEKAAQRDSVDHLYDRK